MHIFQTDRTALVLIDVQEKLFSVMQNRESLLHGLLTAVRGLALLKVPILWLEQNPEKMGPTIEPLREPLADNTPIAKMSFSCCGAEDFLDRLRACGRDQILVAGIETHVCVAQTALHLMQQAFAVQVITDAVSSRHAQDHEIALQRIRDAANQRGSGPALTTAETILFELMQSASHLAFRDMLPIVR